MSILLPLLLRWGISQAEQQLEKMQDAAYDTPGAESPIPPRVILGFMGLISGHFLLGSGLMKLRKRVAFLTLIVGAGIGMFAFLLTKH